MAQNMASLIPFRSAIRWAVTGQETSERLIQELKDINDGLYALLPPPYWKDVSRAVIEHLTSTEEWQLFHKFAVADNSQNDAVFAMATNKEMVIRASSAVLSQLDLEELWISPMLVTVDTLSTVATTGKYSASEGEVSVLIEWKRHNESLKSRPTDFKRLLTRVDNIARILHLMPKPERFRTLRCLNFFDDTKEDRFGIVFETPRFFSSKISRGY